MIYFSQSNQRRKMRVLKIILFILGLLFEITAFLGSQAENIPFVLKIVSPRYVEALTALSRMEKEMVLYPKDTGFEQLSWIFIEELSKQNPPEKIQGLTVSSISREKAVQSFTTKRVKEKIPIVFSLSNGQKLELELEELSERIDKIKTTGIFKASVIIFILGNILLIVGFVIEMKKE